MEKRKDLSYIEDSKEYHKKLDTLAKDAVRSSIEESKRKNVEITYLMDEKLVKELPSGEISVITSIQSKRRKVQIGSKGTL